MKTIIIDGVKVVKDEKGRIELHLNGSFDGKKLQSWRDKNKIALNEFRYN